MIQLYFDPACPFCARVLDHLSRNNIPFEEKQISLRADSPNKQELTKIIKMLGISPRLILRTTEPEYKDAGLDEESISDEQIIEAICRNPPLLQRPIVVKGNKAIIGRPPTKVLEFV